MSTRITFRSAVPPTPGEAAAMTARWKRGGFLGRLVRIQEPVGRVETAPAAARRQVA